MFELISDPIFHAVTSILTTAWSVVSFTLAIALGGGVLVGIALGLRALCQRSAQAGTLKLTNKTKEEYELGDSVEQLMEPKPTTKKKAWAPRSKRVFVVNFRGSIAVLRRAVNTVLLVARKGVDRVVVRVESGGGTVQGFGLGAAHMLRLRKFGLHVVACIDKVAASGGYMVACCAEWITCAPFATVGSIGVVTEFPNLSRLLSYLGIHFEQITAGPLKRTLSQFVTPTEEGRDGMQQQLNRVHHQFKTLVNKQRPQAKIDEVTNGDVWLGDQAKELNLVDAIMTSDEYLTEECAEYDIYELGKAKSVSSPKKGWKRVWSQLF